MILSAFTTFLKTPMGIMTLVILGIIFFQGSGVPLNVGFEGATVNLYGVNFQFNNEWQGMNEVHQLTDPNPLVSHSYVQWSDELGWVGTPTESEFTVYRKENHGSVKMYPDLSVGVEKNIQFKGLDKQGNPDPLAFNTTDPSSQLRIINYTRLLTTKTPNGDGTFTYSYEAKETSFLLVPAEFTIEFWLIPSQTDTGGTWSGWREGEWQSDTVWFKLDFNTWDNAIQTAWLNDPVYKALLANGTQNSNLLYHGGFPIAGWISEWNKAGYSSSQPGVEQDVSLWLNQRGKTSETHSINELADIKNKLLAKCQFSLDATGHYLDLYNAENAPIPIAVDTQFNPNDPSRNSETQAIMFPDSAMQKTMYFPISIKNFGTLSEGGFNNWDVYYPSYSVRVRVIYGVYGTFNYLWTVKSSQDVGYTGYETHQTIVVHQSGIYDWLGGLTTNPLFWVVIILVILILVAIIGVFVGLPLMPFLMRPMFAVENPCLVNPIHIYRDGGGNV